jgi:hypothetical protein
MQVPDLQLLDCDLVLALETLFSEECRNLKVHLALQGANLHPRCAVTE